MSSDRLRTQIKFEEILSGNNITVWQSLTKAQIKNFAFNNANRSVLQVALMEDCIDFYYKGILSLNEGIIAIETKNFSWATVKMYYSVYYLLRSSLCCNQIGFVRKERDAFNFDNNINGSPLANGKPDHMAAIDLFKKYFELTDFLQSNKINGANSYDWLRHQRENINYKYRTFFEPDVPVFWENVNQQCEEDGIEFWLRKYLDDDIYAFLDDHAVLALPLKRLLLTHKDLVTKGFIHIISPDKITKLNELIINHEYLRVLRSFYTV